MAIRSLSLSVLTVKVQCAVLLSYETLVPRAKP